VLSAFFEFKNVNKIKLFFEIKAIFLGILWMIWKRDFIEMIVFDLFEKKD